MTKPSWGQKAPPLSENGGEEGEREACLEREALRQVRGLDDEGTVADAGSPSMEECERTQRVTPAFPSGRAAVATAKADLRAPFA